MLPSYSYQGLSSPFPITQPIPQTAYSSFVSTPEVFNNPSLSGAKILSRKIIYNPILPQISYPETNSGLIPGTPNIISNNSLISVPPLINQSSNLFPIQYPLTNHIQNLSQRIQNSENVLSSGQLVKLIPTTSLKQNSDLRNQNEQQLNQDNQGIIGNIIKTSQENNNDEEYSNDSLSEDAEEFDKALFNKFQEYKAQKRKERNHYYIEERPISKNMNLVIKHPMKKFNKYHENNPVNEDLNEEDEFYDFINKSKNKSIYTQSSRKKAGSLSNKHKKVIPVESRSEFSEKQRQTRNQYSLNTNQNIHTFDDQNLYRLIPVSSSQKGLSYNIPTYSNAQISPHSNMGYSLI